MSNGYFQFKQFIIHQDRCAMKVGTDGTLLGAWASAGEGDIRILDIGTGTGIVGLMMAQRFPKANVLCIDIDKDAISQALENIKSSPFCDRMTAMKQDITLLDDSVGFDAIVCNPPYFENALTCPDDKRTIARHSVSLNFQQLTESAFKLLKTEGKFSVIIPSDSYSFFETNARLCGFFISKVCKVHSVSNKPPKRYLIELVKRPVNELVIKDCILQDENNERSSWYHELTNDFYIK